MSQAGLVTYGGNRVAFRLIRAKRKTMEIAVHPDQKVVVKAPWGASQDKVTAKVKKRVRWILRQQDYFSQFKPRTPIRRYCSGETHLYLGRPYRLKVIHDEKNKVDLIGRILRIQVRNRASRQRIKGLLETWYRTQAYRVLGEVLETLWMRFNKNGSTRPVLHVRRMNRRWGSLSPSNALTLKLDLIRTPKSCIEYVVAHELCHLEYRDHGPDFFKFLDKMMPDWEKRKQRLELALI